jgi:hypothetical protein
VQKACIWITWVLPLPKPEFRELPQTRHWAVEAEISLRAGERHKTPPRDIGEARDAQEVDEDK